MVHRIKGGVEFHIPDLFLSLCLKCGGLSGLCVECVRHVLTVLFYLFFSAISTRGIKLILDKNKTGNLARVNVVHTLRRGGVPVSCVANASVKTVIKSLCTVNCSPSSVRGLVGSRSFGQ